MIDRINACIPNTPILLEIENSLLTSDVGDRAYIKPETPEAAQAYSKIMRDSGLSLASEYPNVHVMDLQELVYGVEAPATSPMMKDQLHPGPEGQKKEAEVVLDWLRKVKPAAR